MRAGLAVTLLLAALCLTVGDTTPLRRLENATQDVRFQWRGARAPGGNVLILLIDDAALDAVGRWPWPRRRIADIVERLDAAGAALIVVNLLLSDADPDPGGDAALAEAVARSGRVVLPFFLASTPTDSDPAPPAAVQAAAYRRYRSADPDRLPALAGAVAPVPALANAAAGLGHVNLFLDGDGRSRHEAMAVQSGEFLYPPLALAAARLHRGLPPEAIVLDGREGVWLGDALLPTDAAGRLLVNHLGPAGTIETVSAGRFLRGDVPPERIAGRVVVVGAAITGLEDEYATPFDPGLPGVERQAALLDTLLTGRLLRRDGATRVADVAVVMAVGIAASAAATLGPAAAAALLLILAGITVSAIHQAFVQEGVALNLGLPLLAIVLPAAAVMLAGFVRLRRVRRAVASYLPTALLEQLDGTATRAPEGERTLTVLFADVRGFSAISERLAPADLLGLMSDYYAVVTPEVERCGGYVDKYMGDGLLAVFGTAPDRPYPALDACRCALAMRRAVAAEGDRWRRRGVDELRIGVGVHTGVMVIGTVGGTPGGGTPGAGGHAGRRDYTVLGDNVNVAARLETATKRLDAGILISDATWEQVRGHLAARELGLIDVTGRIGRVKVYALSE